MTTAPSGCRTIRNATAASSATGQVEIFNRRLKHLSKSMLVHAGLPLKFWARSVVTAAYILNRLPSKRFHDDTIPGLTPYEHMRGHAPSIDHLRVFGSLCYPHIPSVLQSGSTVISANPHIFVGYDEYSSEGYVVYDPETNQFLTRRTVTFDETWRQRHLRLGHLPAYADNPVLGEPDAPAIPLHTLLQPVTSLPVSHAPPVTAFVDASPCRTEIPGLGITA